MTAAVEEPLVAPSVIPHDMRRARPLGVKGPWEVWRDRILRWKLIETLLLIWIASLLYHDRAVICDQYLFKYTDEDQAIMWSAAHDALEGKFHEPCFWGQDYNSCFEGYVAAPMIAMGMEYNVAVPLATVMLGLLPFVLLAVVAWWRGHTLVSAGCLLVPILLPVRYSMITGIPRGFVTGNALAILPAILLLPPRRRKAFVTADGEEPKLKAEASAKNPLWLHRSWPALRYFLAAVLAVVALQVNQSCAILLVPVAVYAVLTSFREWKFWVFGLGGLLAASPYPIYVYQFYHRYHDDYRMYLRGGINDVDKPLSEHFSSTKFTSFFESYIYGARFNTPSILADLVPIHTASASAPFFLVCAFILVLILLVVRRRTAAVIAAFIGTLFLFLSMGFDRVTDPANIRGNNDITFPHVRLFLSIPIVFVWMMFLVNTSPWQRFRNTPASRWLSMGALIGLLLVAQAAVKEKEASTPTTIAVELGNSQICRPIPIDLVYATAYEVQKAADATKADVVVVGQSGPTSNTWAYLLPAITTCETLFAAPTERRTWRFIEENQDGRHQKILFINEEGVGTRVGGGEVTVDSDGYVVEGETTTPGITPTPGPNPNPAGGAGGGGGRGGRGGQPPAGGGGRGGPGGAGGPGGGRGRGGRGMNGTFGGTSPGSLANLPPTHTVQTPVITMAPITNNAPLLATLRKLGVNVPFVVHTPAATPANPHPGPIIDRQSWGR